jgi:CRISPR-associated endonuclease/helicase Cas3
MIDHSLLHFWGKAAKSGNSFHPALCHMIDVGIVAGELVNALPLPLQKRILSILGRLGKNGLAFLVSLHDIGKISPGFQIKRKDLCTPIMEAGLPFPKHAESKHGKIAASQLPEILEDCFECTSGNATILSQVLAAHHGTFISYENTISGGKKWDDTRRRIATVLAKIFGVDSLRSIPACTSADLLLFAGLLTMADWLGSSEKHFPFIGNKPFDIPLYLKDRSAAAKEQVRMHRMSLSFGTGKPFESLFPFHPNRYQEAVLKVVSKLKHPMLIIVETPMGSGKTEAAQAVFAELACKEDLRGMYCALPTQATSNAIFPRMKAFLENLELTDQTELHLLHANADLNPEYENLKLSSIGDLDSQTEKSVIASSWFTPRKRGLLSNFGVGTIDQAIMAALKVRHFFLRLFGLAGKIVILDEVHAYDAYMSEEIDRLIGWLRHCDSTVVLLSATLPQFRRKSLLGAFSQGLTVPDGIRYPCIIGVDSTGQAAWEEISEPRIDPLSLYPVICKKDEKAKVIARLVTGKLSYDGCAACILNTVAEAQAVYDELRRHDDADIILFHSRYTLDRRSEIENYILSRYGKNGSRPRKGIVIATQVLEQSLDIDFDFMVSDLAPIDLLLQRAGRLHRHQNQRPELLKDRALSVVMPDILHNDTDFGGSGFVYFPDILLKTARILTNDKNCQTLTVNLPYDVSPLIETVYGAQDPFLSAELQRRLDRWADERLGAEMANRFVAREAALADANAFMEDPEFFLQNLSNDNDDERVFSSRLGRPSITLVIANEGDILAPNGMQNARALYAKSLTTDNRHLFGHFINKQPPEGWLDSTFLRNCRPLILRNGQTEIAGRIIKYDDEYGLRILSKGE